LTGQIDTIGGWKSDVHQYDIRTFFGYELEGAVTISSLAYDRKSSGFVEDATGSGAQKLVIVHHDDPPRFA